ncbi:hypothetical protein XENOCAPTIV_022630 [Xenoophorus captivus]|uniref:Uncharacterized protein n=1 Tax=Xenoophorus captivus TaxID=1517983 RepID=A0ABV0QB67_9TELE
MYNHTLLLKNEKINISAKSLTNTGEKTDISGMTAGGSVWRSTACAKFHYQIFKSVEEHFNVVHVMKCRTTEAPAEKVIAHCDGSTDWRTRVLLAFCDLFL